MRRRSGRSGSRSPSSTHPNRFARTARPSVLTDVVLAEEMASLRDAAKRLAVRSHLVAAEPLVGVVDLCRCRTTSLPRRTAARPESPVPRPSVARFCGLAPRRRARSGAPAPATSAARQQRQQDDLRTRQEKTKRLRNVPAMNIFGGLDVATPVPACRDASARPSPCCFPARRHGLEEDGRRHLSTTRPCLGSPQTAFPTMKSLNVEVVRMLLTWGGATESRTSVLPRPTDPADPAYGVEPLRPGDRGRERRAGMEVLLTIAGTPAVGERRTGPSASAELPRRPSASSPTPRHVATAARSLDTASGRILPRVDMWLAWNEPNSSVFLQPQFERAWA